MSRALIHKELSEHWVPIVALGLASTAAAGFLALGTTRGAQFASALEAQRFYLLSAAFVVAGVMAGRVVVREYSGSTQLFLESLPVTRARVVTIKLIFSLLMVLGIIGIATAISLGTEAFSRTMPPGLARNLILRTLGFSVFLHALFFFISFIGRYRFALLLTMFFGVFFVDEQLGISLTRYPPLGLVDSTLAYESETIPWRMLGATLGISASFYALTYLLALAREGSLAALLATSMSHREKVSVAVLFFLGLLGLAVIMDQKNAEFALPDSVAATSPGVRLEVSQSGSDEHDSQELADSLHSELQAAKAFFGIDTLPPVFVSFRSTMDAGKFRRGDLTSAEGVLVQLRFPATQEDRADFIKWLLPELLQAHTHGRATQEDRRWLLDGVGIYWVNRHTAGADLVSQPTFTSRALYAAPDGITLEDLAAWLSLRERIGQNLAASLAYSGLRALAKEVGADTCEAFLRAVFSPELPADFRGQWRDPKGRWQSELVSHAGVDREKLIAVWNAELKSAGTELGAKVAKIPRLLCDASVDTLSERTRALSYRLVATPDIDPDAFVELRIIELPLIAGELDTDEALLRSFSADALASSKALEYTYAPGARVAFTIAFEVEELGCEVISPWQRRTLE